MQFLDAIGLASFWEKIKDWANSRFFSKSGGYINPKTGLQYTIDGEQLSITISGNENETIDIFNVDENRMEAIAIVKTGGTATQVLMADGSVKTLNANNGIAGLDANGNVPLSQLGNLDTTVAEVVTALPTTNIKKHIYLIKDTSGVTQNQYKEYIYTGDTSATYDASKWEKLGDFRATVDLADYAKKSEAANRVNANYAPTSIFIKFIAVDGHDLSSLELFGASSNRAGLMIAPDKNKLDGIADNANNYSLPTASSTIKGGITLGYPQSGKNYPVVLDSNGKAYVNVPWTDTNTTYDLSPYAKKVETVDYSSIRLDKQAIANTPQGLIEKQVILFSSLGGKYGEIVLEEATSNMSGLMSIRDKNKLDYIADGATADSAIPISVINALN
jgi:hypothetical protein|nr:MAG TPA: hypothetical protein [Bacteriophage sp.]